MQTLFKSLFALSISAAVAALSATEATAQAAKATVEPPTFDVLPSPEFGGGKNKAFRPKDWLEVEAKINLAMSPEPPSKTADRMTVKWYVAVKHPERSGSFLLLTKDVEHVNVPIGEDIYSSVYLSPASLRRITGTDRAGKGAVELVGFEVLVNGQKVGEETNKQRVGWWTAASDKISRSDTVPLLNKAETPFSNMWWDRYAEIQAER